MSMRDNKWLAERLSEIRRRYFPDVQIENTIYVRFGRANRTRFGSIIARPRAGFTRPVTYITINSLFKTEEVPDYVIDATLVHEFVHYTHGFHSPLEHLYNYPHKGGIVNKEIRKRGAGEILDLQTTWIKNYYSEFLKNHYAKRAYRF